VIKFPQKLNNFSPCMGSRPTSLIVLVYVVIATDSTTAQKDEFIALNF